MTRFFALADGIKVHLFGQKRGLQGCFTGNEPDTGQRWVPFLLFDGTRLFMLDIYKSVRLSRPATKGEDGSPDSFDRREDT
jgi:hypothetical protein